MTPNFIPKFQGVPTGVKQGWGG